MKLSQLRAQAKNRGITGFSRMNKPQLEEFLKIKMLEKDLPKLDISNLSIINTAPNKKLYLWGTKEQGTQVVVTHDNNIVTDVELLVENTDPEKVFELGNQIDKKMKSIAWLKFEKISMGPKTIRKCQGIHVKVIQFGQGKGYCTCCVSKLIFAGLHCHKKKLKRGFVHIVSKNGRAAFHCYTRAFQMNGFELVNKNVFLEEDGLSANVYLYFSHY